MIAPGNSKTAFLPAAQQKCPEKAVFVFCKKSLLNRGSGAPIVSTFAAIVSPKLLGFGRKAIGSIFEIPLLKALEGEESAHRLRRGFWQLRQFGLYKQRPLEFPETTTSDKRISVFKIHSRTGLKPISGEYRPICLLQVIGGCSHAMCATTSNLALRTRQRMGSLELRV